MKGLLENFRARIYGRIYLSIYVVCRYVFYFLNCMQFAVISVFRIFLLWVFVLCYDSTKRLRNKKLYQWYACHRNSNKWLDSQWILFGVSLINILTKRKRFHSTLETKLNTFHRRLPVYLLYSGFNPVFLLRQTERINQYSPNVFRFSVRVMVYAKLI